MMTHEEGVRSVLFGTVTFLAGLAIGFGAGLLLAPQSGERTRRQLHDLAEDFGERASTIAGEASDAVREAVEKGRRIVR